MTNVSLEFKGSTRAPVWVIVVVAVGALLLSTGGLIALIRPGMLASPYDPINGAVRIYAGYLASRNFAVAFLLVALLAVGAQRALGNLLVLVGIIQILDAGMDAAEGRWAVAPGVLVLAAAFFVAAARLSDGYPFWKIEAWIAPK